MNTTLHRLTDAERVAMSREAERQDRAGALTKDEIVELWNSTNTDAVLCSTCGIELAPGTGRLAQTFRYFPIVGMFQCRGAQECIDRSIATT